MFSSSKEFLFFICIHNADDDLWQHGQMHVSVNPLSAGVACKKSFWIRLKDYVPDEMIILSSIKIEDLSPDYYEFNVNLYDRDKNIIDTKKCNFIISPAETVALPTAFMKGTPLSQGYVFLYGMAGQYESIHKYDKAESLYRRAFEMNPDYKKGIIEYADFLLKMGKSAESLELAEKIGDNGDFKFQYHFLKGKALMEIKKYVDAIAHFLKANKIYNSNTSLLNWLGCVI